MRQTQRRVTPDQVRALLAGGLCLSAPSEHPLLRELYSKLQGQCLRPKTVVCYDREAFLYPPGNVRVTLDRNVRSGLGSLDFLNPKARYVPTLEGLTVLEVKYDAFLPELIAMAVQIPRAAACSKYAICRRYD